MKTQEQLEAYVGAHPGWTYNRMKNALSMSTTAAALRAAVARVRGEPQNTGVIPAIPNPPKLGQPLATLVNQFDDVKKVRDMMKRLAKDSYMEDDEMRRELRISPDRWKSVCNHPAIKQWRFTLPNRKTVWMHVESQEKLTSAINLDHA